MPTNNPNLQTQLAPNHPQGLLLRNPIMPSSGAVGFGFEYITKVDITGLGAIVAKGTTLHPRAGNPQPRIHKVTSGLINAVGLENPGIDVIINEYLPIWQTWPTPVIINIAGDSIDEFVVMAQLLEAQQNIAAIEVNVSCPNIRKGGAVFGDTPASVSEVTREIRAITKHPLIIKLSPNPGDLRPIALAAAEAGADAISLINTITSLRIDINTRKPVLGHGTGGLSGPAIMPIALRMVQQVATELRHTHPNVPIIGIGGISTGADAIEFLMAGATALQIGTAHIGNPRAAIDIAEQIQTWLTQQNIQNITDIIGTVPS